MKKVFVLLMLCNCLLFIAGCTNGNNSANTSGFVATNKGVMAFLDSLEIVKLAELEHWYQSAPAGYSPIQAIVLLLELRYRVGDEQNNPLSPGDAKEYARLMIMSNVSGLSYDQLVRRTELSYKTYPYSALSPTEAKEFAILEIARDNALHSKRKHLPPKLESRYWELNKGFFALNPYLKNQSQNK